MPPLSGTIARLAKPGSRRAARGGDPQVAAEREVEAVAGGRAVQRGDDGVFISWSVTVGRSLVRPSDRAATGPALSDAAAADAGARHRVLDVEPGAESGAGAGEDRAPHAAVALDALDGLAELHEHRHRDRVASVRTVEGDRGHVPSTS